MHNTDATLINKLWWLNKFLNQQWKNKKYKDIYNKELTEEICKEIDEIVEHIKEKY